MQEPISDNLTEHKRTGKAPAVELTDLRYRQIVEDVRRQPAWRATSDKCAAYYDGRQLTTEEAEQLQQNGLSELIANMVKPAVNALLGMEAKTRTDWRVVADRDEDAEVSEAMSAKLTEAERETRADVACSDAFKSQVVTGIGWVYVGRNSDPFGYEYLVEDVHRQEMHWDWSAKRADLSDARYVVREKWYPAEQLTQFFPERAELLAACGTGWAPEWLDIAKNSEQLLFAFNAETSGDWFEEEWRNVDLRLLKMREVWYRHYVRGITVRLPDGRTVEFDKRNPLHVAGLAQGVLSPREAVYSKLRVSLWVGPHKLLDEDYGSLALPYVPFWGYRDDLTRAPYGVVRDMIPMQDEINARRRKLLWLLSSKRVVVDNDALDLAFNDFEDLAREAARPDALVVLNSNRRNGNALTVGSDLNLSTQQYQVMMESQQAIQNVAGIYNSMMGRTDGAKSGTAINALVDQGTTTQGEINDNYRFSRTLVGQRLLELIVQDMTGKEVEVVAGEENRRKVIILNRPVVDSVTGIEYRENDVQKALVKVALADVPSTPAYRAQTLSMLSEIIKGLPPQLQAPLMPYFLEATEHPKRREMADIVRKVLGINDEDDPAAQAAQQQIAEMQAAMQQGVQQYEQQIAQMQQQLQQLQLERSNREGELALKQQELAIKAQGNPMDDQKTQAEIQRIQAEIQRIHAETLRTRADTARTLNPGPEVPAPTDM